MTYYVLKNVFSMLPILNVVKYAALLIKCQCYIYNVIFKHKQKYLNTLYVSLKGIALKKKTLKSNLHTNKRVFFLNSLRICIISSPRRLDDWLNNWSNM